MFLKYTNIISSNAIYYQLTSVLMMKIDYFFSRYPVFTLEEFTSYLIQEGSNNVNTHRELLAYHIKKNHLLRIRTGLYAVVPHSINSPKDFMIDPYLIVGRIAKDAILSYQTALDFHGLSYSIHNNFYYCSNSAIKSFQFQGQQFQRISFPKILHTKKQENFATIKRERQGMDIKVTSLERTLVDVLNRPDLTGGWEEIWRSLEAIAAVDVELVIKYAVLLNNATTIAKLGYFFEMHQAEFSITDTQLKKLEKCIPKGKHYFDNRKTTNGKLFKRWNLIIPLEIINKSWEEPNEIV